MSERSGYRDRVKLGVVWMVLSSLVAKGGTFAAQIVLGWILLPDDFGVFSIALSVTSFVQIIRDGGMRKILVQKGERRYAGLIRPVFWIAALCNTGAALVIALLAYPMAALYGEPILAPMMLVMALGPLVGTAETIHRASLSVRMKYRELAVVNAVNGLARSASLIVFALMGFGAMSFAWPALVAAIAGWIAGVWYNGSLGVWGSLGLRLWGTLLRTTWWMMLGSGGLTVIRLGPYAILGLIVSTATLGEFYFAFQLILQFEIVVALNLQSVLLPTLSAIKDTGARHQSAVIRAVRSLTALSSIAGMGIGVIAPDLMRFVWGDRWLGAVIAVQIMAMVFPLRMVQSVIEPALMSRGRWVSWAKLMWIYAGIIVVASVLGGRMSSSAGGLALSIGIGYLISTFVLGAMSWRTLGFDRDRGGLFSNMAPSWVVVSGVYLLVLLGRAAMGINGDADRVVLGIRMIGVGLVYGAMSLITLRVLSPGVLVDLSEALPGRVSGIVLRVFGLEDHGKERGRFRARLIRMCSRFTWWIALLGLIVWWSCWALRADVWWCDVVMSLGAPVVVVLGALSVIGACGVDRVRKLVVLALASGSLLVLAQGRRVFPETRAIEEGSGSLRVLTMNIGLDNSDVDGVVSLIVEEDADIVVCAEPYWKIFESVVRDQGGDITTALGYTHRVYRRREALVKTPILVMSRWALTPIQGMSDEGGLAMVVERPEALGGAFVLLAAHPASPRNGERWGAGNTEIEILCSSYLQHAQHLADLPVLVAGDMNCGGMSLRDGMLRDRLGVSRSKPILTLGGTFPSEVSIVGVAIDDVWHDAAWAVRRWSRVPVPGSDHVGVSVELGLDGAREQSEAEGP